MINLGSEIATISQSIINTINNTANTTTNTENVTTNNQTILGVLNEEIDTEFHHNTLIFPEYSGKTWALTAGATNNVFSDWAEIVDSEPVALSDRGSPNYHMHISAVVLEDASVKDKIYNVEIAYSNDYTRITRCRFMTGNAKEGASNVTKVRAEYIPNGEPIFYRLQCETANATCQLHIRFHLDPN